jgi:outer membrane lipoprotein-sorting protein
MKTLILFMSITLVLILGTGADLTAQMTGKQIMESVYNNPGGDDSQGELTMKLTNKHGEQRVRMLKQYLKDDGSTEKKIMYFISPADVRGTSFMSWSYSNGDDDDQWIYLPALKRTKRISSDGKSDYFMGSDFTYDDLGDRHPDQDKHNLLRDEILQGKECYVVESIPVDKEYMYSKTITWVMKDSFLGLKREFYDDDGSLLKILSINNYDKIEGFWTILETEMKNVQKDHSTMIEFKNVKINQGIADSKFSERSMTIGK